MISGELELENPLWVCSLQVYPKIESELLALQAEGARVNYLLAAIWLGSLGKKLTRRSPEADSWYEGFTAPLRNLRFALRPLRQESAQLQPAYDQLKVTELHLEQIELALFYREYRNEPGSANDTAHMNLVWVLSQFGLANAEQKAKKICSNL